jgi:hypothetical protein
VSNEDRKFAAVFYTGGKPEDNIASTGDNTVPTPGSPRPGAVDYFAISDAHGDKIVPANAIMSIGGQVSVRHKSYWTGRPSRPVRLG